MLRSGVVTLLTIALSVPVLAQSNPMTAPIPVTPKPTQDGAGAIPGQPNEAEQQQRLRRGGSPADTAASPRTGGSPDTARAASATPAGAIDEGYVRDTLAAGTVTLQASTFARTKAQNPRVKQFAAWEEAEQNLLTEVLRGLAEPAATSSTGSREAATAPVISDEGSAMMQRMSQAQPGPAFDRDYVNLQLEKHRELAAIRERFLSSNPRSHEQATIAKLALGHVREHIAQLEDIGRQLSGTQQ
jgi:predicted outer membrane protein